MSVRTRGTNEYHYDFQQGGKRYWGVCEGCTTKAKALAYEKRLRDAAKEASAQKNIDAMKENVRDTEMRHTSILEQNFDELYAQVEERVKCIKPVKQIDTFTKILMWTSLNEILMDVFGGSRFMWYIADKDLTTFEISFVDIHRVLGTHPLTVPYVFKFEFPQCYVVERMSYEELLEFRKQYEACGYGTSDVCSMYNKPTNWFSSLLGRRKIGIRHSCKVPIHGGVKAAADKWDYTKYLLYRMYVKAKEHNIPMIYQLLTHILGFPEFKYSDYRDAIYSWEHAKGISISVDAYLADKFEMSDVDEWFRIYCKIFAMVLEEMDTDTFVSSLSAFKKDNPWNSIRTKLNLTTKYRTTKWVDGVSYSAVRCTEDAHQIMRDTIAILKTLTTKEVKND